jgi:hypothetical protein
MDIFTPMNFLMQFLCLFSVIAATAHAETLDTARIEQIIGLKGALNTNEGVFKVTAPRTDVKLVVDGWTMSPFMGLGTWAASTPGSMGGAMVMGDSHMTDENPRTLFLHYWGRGKTEDLAKALKAALAVTKNDSR